MITYIYYLHNFTMLTPMNWGAPLSLVYPPPPQAAAHLPCDAKLLHAAATSTKRYFAKSGQLALLAPFIIILNVWSISQRFYDPSTMRET